LGCHRRRVDDRIVFDKLVQVLRFGCSYEAIADATCSATTIRGSSRSCWQPSPRRSSAALSG
jgi:transposase